MKVLACVFLCGLIGLGKCQQLPSTQVNACETQSGVVGDNTYCDRYWECVEGHADLYNCPNGLVFVGKNRGIAEGCDYPWRGSYCQNRARPAEDKPRANPPISTPHCDWLYGIFGHETSCTRYWTCWNGTATEQFCIGGLLYNEETHACDWPQNVEGCQKHPLCRDDPNANVPLGKSCERYWSCQGGYPRLQRCPATLVFNKLSRRCVSPPTVDCEAPPPPPPSENEENGFDGAPRRNNPNRRRGSSGGQSRLQGSSGGQSRLQAIPQRSNVDRPFQEEQRQRISETSVPRPRRPLLPNFPAGATQIEFNTPQQRIHSSPNVLRPAPIEGAIPLRQN